MFQAAECQSVASKRDTRSFGGAYILGSGKWGANPREKSVVGALKFCVPPFANQNVTMSVDEEGALHFFIVASSSHSCMDTCAGASWWLLARADVGAWLDRVQSASNPVGTPSRKDRKRALLRKWGVCLTP